MKRASFFTLDSLINIIYTHNIYEEYIQSKYMAIIGSAQGSRGDVQSFVNLF